jgi:hypothetical protein
MAVAFVQEWDGDADDRSTNNYDAIREALHVDADKPAGLIVHTAGFAGGGVFRIFDVWESEEHVKRFLDERLMPTVEKVMAGGGTGEPPAREYTYELHDIVRG